MNIMGPISAEAWRTMDETMFRSIVQSKMTALVSIAALTAIRERCASLGIELESEPDKKERLRRFEKALR